MEYVNTKDYVSLVDWNNSEWTFFEKTYFTSICYHNMIVKTPAILFHVRKKSCQKNVSKWHWAKFQIRRYFTFMYGPVFVVLWCCYHVKLIKLKLFIIIMIFIIYFHRFFIVNLRDGKFISQEGVCALSHSTTNINDPLHLAACGCKRQ